MTHIFNRREGMLVICLGTSDSVALFPVNLRREICYIPLAEQNLQYKKDRKD